MVSRNKGNLIIPPRDKSWRPKTKFFGLPVLPKHVTLKPEVLLPAKLLNLREGLL